MLDKAIQSGKEHRQPYRNSERFDKSCRNHGGCGWCLGNRLHKNYKRLLAAQETYRDLDIPFHERAQICRRRMLGFKNLIRINIGFVWEEKA